MRPEDDDWLDDEADPLRAARAIINGLLIVGAFCIAVAVLHHFGIFTR